VLALTIGAAIVLGFSALAVLIGERFPTRNPRRSQVATLAVGVLALLAIDLVPWLGFLVLWAMSILAFGAVLRTRFGSGPENDANFAPAP
jgi:hypothetical protein